MNDDQSTYEYLAKGGKLSSPENTPARYRAELMRQMASFVDSELAGAAGFADCVNYGPGIKERIAASRIVLEKHDHAERVLKLMGEFGANTDRYQSVHPWHERAGREENLGHERHGGDMRLNVFHYPIEGWADAVTMNVMMGEATVLQIGEFAQSSYQPLAETIQGILPREKRHLELGKEGTQKLVRSGTSQKQKVEQSLIYWRPRIAASFGGENSRRLENLKKLGLRKHSNEELRSAWESAVDKYFRSLFSD
ncbi:MAG: phenylacetate-CoA oxygenase subunit PaaI [Marinicaulis sp.]|nr:phenylacetate-CoA oxygenase subunit PaaI [Marinicaulis sp.]